MDLPAKAKALRELHRPGEPLVLANAWDAASAKNVEKTGFPAVATTSAGVAHALGYEDHQDTPPDEMFAAVARMAQAVDVPVTADLEAGYGLAPSEVVERMLDAGVVGLNFEDTDYASGGEGLVDPQTQATRIGELREAARAAGVDIVINARTDAYVQRLANPLETSLERGRLYLDAGADCIYPILAKDEAEIARLASELDGRLNVLYVPGAPEIARLAELGVARISVGSGLAMVASNSHERRLESLREGRPYW